MGNEVFESIETVMAVREYAGRELPADAVRRVLDAGRLTASASNRQPWHFVLVRDAAGLRKLASMMRTGPYIANAAAAVIVGYEKESGEFGISDGSRAIQSMMIGAWGDGIGSNWTGFAHRHDDVRAEFGFPDHYDILAIVPLGYPKRKVIGRKKRKPFDEVVSAERFGTPLR